MKSVDKNYIKERLNKNKKERKSDNDDMITFGEAIDTITKKTLDSISYEKHFKEYEKLVVPYDKLDNYYIDCDNKQFPIFNNESNCIDCKLTFLNFLKSSYEMNKLINENGDDKKINYFDNIKEKAREIFNENECNKTMNIKFGDDDQPIDLISFTELFYFDVEELNDEIFESIIVDFYYKI